jgi:transcriptional regulator with XRE-family HTH domain
VTIANHADTLRRIDPQFRGVNGQGMSTKGSKARIHAPTNPATTIGGRLQQARRAAKLSQQHVGGLFSPKITRSAVAQWETGAALPDLNRLSTLAFAYGVSIDWIVTGRAAPEHARPPELREHLSPDAVQIAVAWMLLSQDARDVWRMSLYRNVAIERTMPWLPRDGLESFADFEAKFRAELESHGVRPSMTPRIGNGHRRKT